MSFDCSVLFKHQFRSNQAIVELAGFDLKRLHVSSDLFLAPEVDNLKGPGVSRAWRTMNNHAQVRFKRYRDGMRCGGRELNARDVNTSGRAIDLTSVDAFDEKCREDLHGQEGNRSHLPVEQSAASLT